MGNNKKKVLIAFGTRPEAIKMAPLIKQFEDKKSKFNTVVCVTAQHREMLDQVLNIFNIIPNYDLNLMVNNQTLSELTSKIIQGVSDVLLREKPDLVIVQGDTITTFSASLAAYYLKVPVAHIEAGLRTKSKYSPFPEEINRRLTSVIADYHFAPTQESKNNLIKEGIPDYSIFVTGNTVIDALLQVTKMNEEKLMNEKWRKFFLTEYNIEFSNTKKSILITGHRRESFGGGFKEICRALSDIANRFQSIQLIYPVHLNPNVQKPVYSILGNIKNIHLIPPLDYLPFIYLMNQCYLILTDSGGIQEEAPALGIPVLVMRDTTERPEGLNYGTAKLVGTNAGIIVRETEKLLTDQDEYKKMAKSTNPYGIGESAKEIYNIIENIYYD